MKASTAAARRAHEAAIMAIAARQHGVVTRAQLLEVGLAPRTVVRRVAAQRVRELHRGVYLVGPLLTDHARAMAAVLACGTGAVVSHCSAALLWRLLTLAKGWEAVDVIVRHGDHRRPGIRTHSRARITPG